MKGHRRYKVRPLGFYGWSTNTWSREHRSTLEGLRGGMILVHPRHGILLFDTNMEWLVSRIGKVIKKRIIGECCTIDVNFQLARLDAEDETKRCDLSGSGGGLDRFWEAKETITDPFEVPTFQAGTPGMIAR